MMGRQTWAVALAAVLAAGGAWAAPSKTGPELAQDAAKLFEKHDWDGAIAAYKESFQLKADAFVLYKLALTYRAKGDCQNALATLEQYRHDFPKAKNADAVEGMVSELQECVDRDAKEQAAKAREQAAKDAVAKDAAPKDEAKKPSDAPAVTSSPAAAAADPAGTPLPPAPPARAGWQTLLSGAKLSLYGMLRADSHYTTSAMNDPRFAMWALSTGNQSFVQGMQLTEQDKNPTFVIHPRLSRFGMDVAAPPIDGLGHPELTGKLEFDFFAGENESRALPRLRHVYGKLQWPSFYLLFGQTTDVISPLVPSVNAEAGMWNAGNLGDRQPQIQIGSMPVLSSNVSLELQAALGQEGSRTNADLDGDKNLDGDLAARPQVQARGGVDLKLWSDEPVKLGGWAVVGRQTLVILSTLPQNVSPKSNFETFAVGGDLTIPVTPRLKFQAEAWQGKNLADLRGGIGQLINVDLGTEVRSMGGWVEALVKPLPFWRVALGASMDKPNADDVPLRGQRSLNEVAWVGNLFTFGQLSIGLDYSHWHTEWVRLNTGIAHRFSLAVIFSF